MLVVWVELHFNITFFDLIGPHVAKFSSEKTTVPYRPALVESLFLHLKSVGNRAKRVHAKNGPLVQKMGNSRISVITHLFPIKFYTQIGLVGQF